VTTELILLSRVAFRDQEITGPRLRGLLALLAGDPRSGCSTARLVDGLWPDEQPENPTKAVQILVSRARALLGAEVILRTPTGYRLSLSEEQVDASAVLLSASATARHARTGDHAAALAQAEAGLALGTGPRAATRGSATRCRRCGRNGCRHIAHWSGLAPWRCPGWGGTPRLSSR
jgi:DNA-binding SARP family transcriptional activator